jgi:hypothetical protein
VNSVGANLVFAPTGRAAKEPKYNMELTDEQRQIMDGARGPFLAKCMRWLVEWGDAMGARRLIPVTNTHALVTVPGNLVWGAGQKTIDSAHTVVLV